MDASTCTSQVAVTNSQATHLSDDFMFGFNVRDDEDREYLAEVAMHGTGDENDIKSFLRLGLSRGVEEWEQAICCASAMRDRASFPNPLDGQDVLTFLAKIYGLGGPSRVVDVQSSPKRLERSGAKRKLRKIRAEAGVETLVERRARKKRRVKARKDSPYWVDVSEAEYGEDDGAWDCLEPKGTAKEALAKREELSEEARRPRFSPRKNFPKRESRQVCAGWGRAYALYGADDKAWDCLESRRTVKETLAKCEELSEEMTPPPSSARTEDTRDYEVLPTRNRPKLTSPASSESKSEPELEPGTFTIKDLVTSRLKIESEKANRPADTGLKHDFPSDNETKQPQEQKETPKRKAKSPYFQITAHSPTKPPPSSFPKSPNKRRPARGTVSALPFPTLDSTSFGLIQEELASDPFRLLIAVTFLIRTSGKAAIPAFRALVNEYPTPEALAAADTADLVARIKHLGLGAVRAAAIQRYTRIWIESPPRDGVRFGVRGYPGSESGPTVEARDDLPHGDGYSSSELEPALQQTTRANAGWEIGHLTQGPYALDSWRIFCRDVLRGVADDWTGAGREGEFQPEWMRVLPADKELRACLRWMWMREGWLWDPDTGEKSVLPDEMRRAVQEGRVGYDESGNLVILGEGEEE